jgi:plasmid stabilization system protein ParE
MRKAFLQQKAKEDVREIALYIADDNLKVAEAFRLALERARLTLADLPEIGRAYDFGNRELKGLRVKRALVAAVCPQRVRTRPLDVHPTRY